MKKYKIIHVLLITALLGFFYSCDLFEEEEEEEEEEETSLLKDNLTQDEIIAIETLENLPRNEQLKLLFTEKMYDIITADAKNNPICVEPNAKALNLPAKPNSEWYYTYENFIKGMTRIIKFAAEGSIQMRKREIAAFFAHVAQETGSGDLYGGGCFIQEKNASSNYYDKNKKGGDASKSYKGRGPIKLSWNYNYKSFSEDMNRPDILQDPDVLTREPEIGIASSFWFWNSITPQWDGSVNPPFKPAPHDVIIGNWTPTRNDIAAGRTKDSYFGVTTNILNGGGECNVTPTKDPQNPSNSRARYFREYARILQVDLEKVTDAELTCFDQSNFAKAPS